MISIGSQKSSVVASVAKRYINTIEMAISTISTNTDTRKLYLDCFEIPLSLLQTEENLEEAVRSLLKDAAKENTLYMEIRFAPLSSVSGGLSCEQVIAAAVNGLKKGRKETGRRGEWSGIRTEGQALVLKKYRISPGSRRTVLLYGT